jgi:uncharacterized protein (DUF4415 family)
MSPNKKKSPLAAYEDKPVDDVDNPEWTEEDFRRARSARELPPEVLEAFPKMRGRPPKPREERKVAISIRLHPMVLEHYKASGPGWQTRMEKVLIDAAFDEAGENQVEPIPAKKEPEIASAPTKLVTPIQKRSVARPRKLPQWGRALAAKKAAAQSNKGVFGGATLNKIAASALSKKKKAAKTAAAAKKGSRPTARKGSQPGRSKA